MEGNIKMKQNIDKLFVVAISAALICFTSCGNSGTTKVADEKTTTDTTTKKDVI